MELVMIVHVILSKNNYGLKGRNMDVCMLPFTGTAEGPYFTGRILGEGVDTQTIYPDGRVVFSARYMMEGTDYKGNSCRVFISNNGETLEKLIPTIETDSEELRFLTEAELTSVIVPNDVGVEVNVYRL